MHRPLMGVAALAGVLAVVPAEAHNYPTAALADYVFACMATNGQTPASAGKVLVQYRRDLFDHSV